MKQELNVIVMSLYYMSSNSAIKAKPPTTSTVCWEGAGQHQNGLYVVGSKNFFW